MRPCPPGATEKNTFAFSGGQRRAKCMSMAALATTLSLTLRSPVVDATSLTDHYDFDFDLSLEERGGMSARATDGKEGIDGAPQSAPSIFAIVSDLGLKLESKKLPFEVFVFDSANKAPAEN
jgi:uncharacterized protein (TIGR03435 family)